MSTTSTLHISISFEHEPIELDILSDKLTWSNLITLIGSLRSIETPITLYYKKDAEGEIETLQTQDQLTQLLIPDIKGLQFYSQKELVTKPVYILPANSFVTLAEFVVKNKSIIASSHRLSRSVGMLAFFIALDTTESKFDHEFEVLENLVARYLAKSKLHEKKQPEESSDEQDYYPELLLDERCQIGGRSGGHHFGRLFSRRGDHHFGGRGGHHFGGRGGFGDFGGPGGPGGPFRGYGGPFGAHGKHFGGRDGPSDSFNGRTFGGKGKHSGRGGKGKRGRCGRASSDTEEFDFRRNFGPFDRLAQRFYEGRSGKREKSASRRHFGLSSEDSSSEEERRARENRFLKQIQRNNFFTPEEERHFHFA